MHSLRNQLEYELKRFGADVRNPIETVFIGGGTPSTVSPELYRPLFETFSPFLAPDAEITSEANPNSATRQWLDGMRNLGVNRISFGVQSFDPAKLETLARAHNPKQALDAVHNAHNSGFEHLSVDLIYGVAGDTRALLEYDLEQAFSLPIDHLSLYALTIEDFTPFAQTPQMAEESLELTRWLFDSVQSRGFTQYEISNFGTYRSKHNLGYWEHREYMGVGAGAVGFQRDKRFYPPTDIASYIQNPLNIRIEPLSTSDLLSEKLFLGFRSIVGVEASLLNADQLKKAQMLVSEGIIEYRHERFFNKDFLLADEIALTIEGF